MRSLKLPHIVRISFPARRYGKRAREKNVLGKRHSCGPECRFFISDERGAPSAMEPIRPAVSREGLVDGQRGILRKECGQIEIGGR